MSESPASFGLVARIFWSILWRSLAIGIPVMFVVGVTTAMAFSHLGNEGANAAARLATFVAMVPVQIVCIQMVIGKTFGKRKLALLDAPVDAGV